MAEDDVGMAVITPDRVALDRAVPDDAAAAPVVDLATLTFRIGRLAMVYNHRDVRWNDHYSLYGGGREQNASEEEKTLFHERQRELRNESRRLQEQRTALLKDSVYLQAFDINPEKVWNALSEEDRRSKKFVLKAVQTVQDIDKCPGLSDTLRDYNWDRDVLLARLDRDDFAQHWDPPFGTIDDAELVLAMVRILPTTLHAASNELWTRPQFVDDVIRTLFDNHDEHCAWKAIMHSAFRVQDAIAPMAIMSNRPSRFVFQSLRRAFYRVGSSPSAFPRHSRVSPSEFFAAYGKCKGEGFPRPFPLCPEMASRDNHATMVELILGHDVRFLRYASERLVLSAEFMDQAITPAFQKQADESWESLTGEQQGQKPFVLAALRNYQRFTVLPERLQFLRYFDNNFPELSADQEVFLARSQLPGFDRAFEIPLRPIPAAFANNDVVMLAVASRHPPYIEHTSGDLLSSEDFVAQAIPIAGYALMASEPARRTLRQFPRLFVQLLTLNVRTEYFSNLTEHASEMASFQWSRELFMAWLTRVGHFPRSPAEHSDTFYPMVFYWYGDTSFMISAISATDRLKTLYVDSEGTRFECLHMFDEWGHGWSFDLMLAAVVSSRDVVAVLESTFESKFFRLYVFAQEVRMKLANRINFRSWVESSFGRSISSLGEEAIKNEIAGFVGVPKAEMVPQLEEALNVLQQLGH